MTRLWAALLVVGRVILGVINVFERKQRDRAVRREVSDAITIEEFRRADEIERKADLARASVDDPAAILRRTGRLRKTDSSADGG